MTDGRRTAAADSGPAKAQVHTSYDSFVVNLTFVLRMKFCD